MRALKLPLLALAFTPIIFYPGALFPYIFPKVLFIRVMLAIFWVGVAVLMFLQHRFPNPSFNLKNPLFLAVAAFMCFVALSTVFAFYRYSAFWGNVERGEGLIQLLFYFSFFIATLLMFSEKDWRMFFGLTLVSFTLLFIDQVYFTLGGSSIWGSIAIGEPMYLAGSLTGNPTFLAAFYLFVILAAAMLFVGRQIPVSRTARIRELAIRFSLGLAILAAVVGIFLSTTRGAIAGLGLGIVAALAFFAVTPNTAVAPVVKNGSRILLVACFVFVAVFAATRHASLWQKIPGLNDIAGLTWQDTTLQTRLTAVLISANAMNPAKVGIARMLIGWGQEQFAYVFQKFYEPRYLRFEALWFDRAHNKLLDVLVMNGMFGFAAYLAIWVFAFRMILKRQNRWEAAALLFFGVSYLVQNIFAFDTIATYIPFFAFLAFVASQSHSAARPSAQPEKHSRMLQNVGVSAAFGFAVFSLIVLVVTLISFRQMLAYVPGISKGRMDLVYQHFDRAVTPYTYVQPELRVSLLQIVVSAVQKSGNLEAGRPLLVKAFGAAQEAVAREGWNSRAYAAIATAYETLGDLASAEAYWKKALEISPRRQDLLYSLALNYARRGRGEEAMALAQEIVALDPAAARGRIYEAVILSLVGKTQSFHEATDIARTVFDVQPAFAPNIQDLTILRNIFQFYLSLFFQEKDSERFLEAMERAKEFEVRYETLMHLAPDRSIKLEDAIDAFKQHGWSAVRLES